MSVSMPPPSSMHNPRRFGPPEYIKVIGDGDNDFSIVQAKYDQDGGIKYTILGDELTEEEADSMLKILRDDYGSE